MKVQNVMTKLVGVIEPQNSILEAARKMKSMNVGALPVYCEKGLTGIITDRDIVVRSSAEGHNPHIVPVESVMTRTVTYVLDESEVEEAAMIMEQKQVRRLPVLNRENKLVGIISLGDIAWKCDNILAGDTLKKICSASD